MSHITGYMHILNTRRMNFITDRVVKRLNIPVLAQSVPIGAINDISIVPKGIIRIAMKSTNDNFSRSLTCLTLLFIKLDSGWRFSTRFNKNISQYKTSRSRLSFITTVVRGVIILRPANKSITRWARFVFVEDALRLGDCWQYDFANSVEIRVVLRNRFRIVAVNNSNFEERNVCESHFTRTVPRNNSGWYIVRLPFRETNRLAALERKF